MQLVIFSNNYNDYRGLKVRDLLNYSVLTQVKISYMSKLSFLKCKRLKNLEFTKTTLELQNYHFSLQATLLDLISKNIYKVRITYIS